MSWILSISDLSLLAIVTGQQILDEMPCEIYIQMPSDFLSSRDLSQITTDEYWFGNDGNCIYNASKSLDCLDPNRTYSNFSDINIEELQCPYPFVESGYKTEYEELSAAGLENCGVACNYYPYQGDISKLDDFNHAASVIALLFQIGFFLNVSMEICKAFNSKTQWSKLPLSFDIPIVISFWMTIFTILLLIPSWAGKQYFGCETGTNAIVTTPAHKTNIHCYIAGQFTMLSVSSIYFYCSLLAFSIWRSLASPFRPLWGIHKIWFHLCLNIVVLGYYIGALSEDIFGAINISGVCGPNVTGDNGTKYLLVPLIFDCSTFCLFMILTIHKLIQHSKHQQKHSKSEKAIIHLAVRMVIYSGFVAASLICMLYVSIQFVYNGDEWSNRVSKNVKCLIDKEWFDPNITCPFTSNIPDDVYWMQGTVVLLVSIASFSLSCSNSKFNDYQSMHARVRTSTKSTITRIKSMASIDGEQSVMSEFRKNSKKSLNMIASKVGSKQNSKNSKDESGATMDIDNDKGIESIDPPQHLVQISSISADDGPLDSVEITTFTPAVSKISE